MIQAGHRLGLLASGNEFPARRTCGDPPSLVGSRSSSFSPVVLSPSFLSLAGSMFPLALTTTLTQSTPSNRRHIFKMCLRGRSVGRPATLSKKLGRHHSSFLLCCQLHRRRFSRRSEKVSQYSLLGAVGIRSREDVRPVFLSRSIGY